VRVLGLLVLAVILSPLTTRYGVNESVKAPPNSYLSPSKLAWLGTDDIGRDLYSRLIYGTRVSLLIGLSSAFISVFVGCVVGAVAGFPRWSLRRRDHACNRLVPRIPVPGCLARRSKHVRLNRSG
jgi:peptide/nickel transport system permease protein